VITFEVDGLGELLKRFDKVPKDMAKEIRKAMNESALRVKADAISSLRRRSIGKTVLRRGIKVLVSKPGDAPNSDTGKLLESVMVSPVKGNMFKGYSVEIKAVTPYAEILEDKKRHNRPFMQPALDKNKPKIRKLIIKAVTKSI
tara:strand:- start:716 stop:1147 length:432 start_codon:yes stop_codon:yes gene_type:complete